MTYIPRPPSGDIRFAPRRWLCDLWPGACGREYHSHSGHKPRACPECMESREFKRWAQDEKRERAKRRANAGTRHS